MAIPRTILPMLAQGGGQPFDSQDYGFEIKWDGLRCLAIADDGLRLQNRHRQIITAKFPELDFQGLPEGCVLDGEVIVFKPEGPSFNALQHRAHASNPAKIAMAREVHEATYVAFDLLYERGEKITALPLRERRRRLEDLVGSAPHDRLLVTDQIVGQGKAYYEAAYERGLEGVIAKRLDSPYLEDKRPDYWSKIVTWRVEPFQVMGYVTDAGAPRAKSVAVGRLGEDGPVYVGRVGNVPEEDQGPLYQALSQAPRAEPPENAPAGVVWCDVDLQCYVRYFPETVTGGLRLARFRGWRGKQDQGK